MPYLLKVKKALKLHEFQAFAGLKALVKTEICVPACRQAGSWQIFVTKFLENICGYTVASFGGVRGGINPDFQSTF